MNATRDTEDDPTERYRAIEYSGDRGPVTIIQDTENDEAWIQSTHTRSIEI